MELLPNDLLTKELLPKLSIRDVITISRLSSRFNKLRHNKKFWEEKYLQDFSREIEKIDYQAIYASQYQRTNLYHLSLIGSGQVSEIRISRFPLHAKKIAEVGSALVAVVTLDNDIYIIENKYPYTDQKIKHTVHNVIVREIVGVGDYNGNYILYIDDKHDLYQIHANCPRLVCKNVLMVSAGDKYFAIISGSGQVFYADPLNADQLIHIPEFDELNVTKLASIGKYIYIIDNDKKVWSYHIPTSYLHNTSVRSAVDIVTDYGSNVYIQNVRGEIYTARVFDPESYPIKHRRCEYLYEYKIKKLYMSHRITMIDMDDNVHVIWKPLFGISEGFKSVSLKGEMISGNYVIGRHTGSVAKIKKLM